MRHVMEANKIKVLRKLDGKTKVDIVLYCFDGVVIAAQCTATLLRSIVLPLI